jgi:hypothetical protein
MTATATGSPLGSAGASPAAPAAPAVIGRSASEGSAAQPRFAKWVFRVAALWALPFTLPMYFTEAQFGVDNPPAVTHPEFYYGFLSLVLAWALGFWVVSTDPIRYRPLMLVGVLEKLSYAIAVPLLVSQGRTPSVLLAFAAADLVFGLLFMAAYGMTAQATRTSRR